MAQVSSPGSKGEGSRGRGRAVGSRIGTDASSNSHPHPSCTFTSSLTIPVPGVIPRPSTPPLAPPPIIPAPIDKPEMSTNGRRAPRKSKTDALAAINNTRAESPDFSQHASTSSSGFGKSTYQQNENDKPLATKLDLDSLPTRSPRSMPPRPPRLFGLEDCPVFYPTKEEFQDPMNYISSVQDQAKNYGICKVIPPEGWQMPFVTDTTTFRFKTRVQRLNSIEASSRAKLNFLEQLYRYHDQANYRPTIPTISHKPLDLWVLRKEVHKRGGYDQVNRGRQWGDIGRTMGLDVVGVSTQLKNAFTRIILPFDTFSARVHGTTVAGSSPSTRPTRSSQVKPRATRMDHNSNSNTDRVSPQTPPRTRPSKTPPVADQMDLDTDSDDSGPESNDPKVGDGSLTSLAGTNGNESGPFDGSSSPLSEAPELQYDKGDYCEICKRGEDDLQMLLCDGCDRGFHTYCLDPRLDIIPRGQWFCHKCLFDTDYGFDEGEEHSLSSFQARARAFRRMWFEAHPPDPPTWEDPTRTSIGLVSISEDDVEKEFWRLVESPNDTVEVEYGADVHSTTHGSAMPTSETHPLDPYSNDPWNLNNMPILPDSLLRYIKSDISGMTIPWTYVGMVFSTFCWHNEDHYTYSINYMHWGDTKTWYGIPGEDTDKFEAAIKSEAPELFEAQPDLLFQLVTLMNPKRLKKAGVRVYAANQRAGEFVITMPQAYHAGFNHGFNFNEAVNFALPNWLPYGRACARRYQEHQKLPVFSHDELLLTITQHSQSVKTATWLHENLKEMTERELSWRERVRRVNPHCTVVHDPHDRPEDQYQCSICKVFCYLSQCTASCTTNITCLEHADSLCACDPQTHLVLRTRFTNAEITETLRLVAERKSLPDAWMAKLEKALIGCPRPSLRSLRNLLQEATSSDLSNPQVDSLKKFVKRALAWVTLATTMTTRRPTARKRARKPRGGVTPEDIVPEPAPPQPEYTLEDAYVLMKESETLGFDSPEIAQLSALVAEAEDFQVKVKAVLAAPVEQRDLSECEVLLDQGHSLNVQLPELLDFQKAISSLRLLNELDEVDDGALTLAHVEKLLARARQVNMAPDHEYYRELENKKKHGEEWRKNAEELMKKKPQDLRDLVRLASPPAWVPVDPDLMAEVESNRSRAKEFEKQAKAMLSTSRERRTVIDDAFNLVHRARVDYVIPAIVELQDAASKASHHERRFTNILHKRYIGDRDHELKNLFTDIPIWAEDIRRSLPTMIMPSFEETLRQFKAHEEWIAKFPWYSSTSTEEADKVYEDVVQSTLPNDNGPLEDPDCTCVCTLPVRVRAGGPGAVQCDNCGARFHGSCIQGSCPFCDSWHWNGKHPKKRSYEGLDVAALAYAAPSLSKNYHSQSKQANTIVKNCAKLCEAIEDFQRPLRLDDPAIPYTVIPQIRQFMRKLYRIGFNLRPSPTTFTYGYMLSNFHRRLASKPTLPVKRNHTPAVPPSRDRLPQLIFQADRSPTAMDGSRCTCRGVNQLGPLRSCGRCHLKYHAPCVLNDVTMSPSPWTCPPCAVREGEAYPYAEIRVVWAANHRYIDHQKWVLQQPTSVPWIVLPHPNADAKTITLTLIEYVGLDGKKHDAIAERERNKEKKKNKAAENLQGQPRMKVKGKGNDADASGSATKEKAPKKSSKKPPAAGPSSVAGPSTSIVISAPPPRRISPPPTFKIRNPAGVSVEGSPQPAWTIQPRLKIGPTIANGYPIKSESEDRSLTGPSDNGSSQKRKAEGQEDPPYVPVAGPPPAKVVRISDDPMRPREYAYGPP